MEDIDTREVAPDTIGGLYVTVLVSRGSISLPKSVQDSVMDIQCFGPFSGQQCTVPGLTGVSPVGAVLAIARAQG